MRLFTPVFLLAATFAAPAMADGALQKLITPQDQQRLDDYDNTRTAALAEARNGGTSEDLAALDAALSGQALTFGDGFDMTGTWRCRTIKLGGPVPLVVYRWFTCRVSDDGAGWRLEKVSGSQRTTGRFYTVSDTRLVYLGAMHTSLEPAMAYGSQAERNQLGIVVRPAVNRLRIEFPRPALESSLDILELQR
jgi:hypothetical protein